MNNLRNRFKRINSKRISFMDTREKATIELNKWFYLDEFDFIKTDLGESLVFTIKGENRFYFFGAPTVTLKFKEMMKLFNEQEFNQLLEEGIEIKFSRRQSKNRRYYTNIEFR